MTLLSWDSGQLVPRDVNWENSDVVTPNDIYFSVRFIICDGRASVIQKRQEQEFAETVVAWGRHSTQARVYVIEFSDGSTWEAVKLKCKCNDPEKAGRVWT